MSSCFLVAVELEFGKLRRSAVLEAFSMQGRLGWSNGARLGPSQRFKISSETGQSQSLDADLVQGKTWKQLGDFQFTGSLLQHFSQSNHFWPAKGPENGRFAGWDSIRVVGFSDVLSHRLIHWGFSQRWSNHHESWKGLAELVFFVDILGTTFWHDRVF